jgi:hypothetical protein
VVKGSLRIIQVSGGLCANLPARARARAGALLSCSGLTWAGFGPILFMPFLFSFSTRAKEILENCRKILKIPNQF